MTHKYENFINNKQNHIIGITGKKFSGKDTLGNYFVKKYDYVLIAISGLHLSCSPATTVQVSS